MIVQGDEIQEMRNIGNESSNEISGILRGVAALETAL